MLRRLKLKNGLNDSHKAAGIPHACSVRKLDVKIRSQD